MLRIPENNVWVLNMYTPDEDVIITEVRSGKRKGQRIASLRINDEVAKNCKRFKAGEPLPAPTDQAELSLIIFCLLVKYMRRHNKTQIQFLKLQEVVDAGLRKSQGGISQQAVGLTPVSMKTVAAFARLYGIDTNQIDPNRVSEQLPNAGQLKASESNWLYILHDPTTKKFGKPISKLGISNDVETRLRSFNRGSENAGNITDWRVFAAIPLPSEQIARSIENTAKKSLLKTLEPFRKEGGKKTLTEVFLVTPISVFRSIEAALTQNNLERLWSYGDYINWRHDLWIEQTGCEQSEEWRARCLETSRNNKQPITEVEEQAKRDFYSLLPDPPDSLPYFSWPALS